MSEIRREERPHDSVVPPLDPTLLKLSQGETAFLRSSISSDEQELYRKLFEVQRESYEKYPYPCIRAFHFVSLFMSQNEVYPEIVQAGRQGNTILLDLGCCMGTDVRKLVQDGYPAINVIGCDLRQEYIDLGYQLYDDKETCNIHFFFGDIFDAPVMTATTSDMPLSKTSSLSELQNRLTHIYTGALFHLFDEATQYAIALRIATLLRRTAGAIVFGRHSGLSQEGMIDDHMARIRYGHSPQSWPRLWKRVFSELEGADFAERHVLVKAVLGAYPGQAMPRGMLWWSVSII